ncbi:MAG: lysophospholipid acyltransferase family protein [Candidatus Hydrogenedentota bacterium]
MRAYFRLGLIAVWVSTTFSFRLIGLIAVPFSHRIAEWFPKTAFVACSRGILVITGIKLSVEGVAPKSPFFLVSNHVSFFDVFVLASRLGCVFVSKAELGDWPLLGFIARAMSTIYIRREDMRDTHRVNQEITSVMNDGLGVVVFAEGTVTQTGQLLDFKPALLQPAVELEMPVHVASIHYATPHAPERAGKDILWRDGVSLIQHFRNIAGLRSCEVTLVFSEETVRLDNRKQLAIALREAVGRIHRPVV